MINFIVVEDNNIILEKNNNIIHKVMFKNKIDYKIYSYSKYGSELKNIISSDLENKVYILDIELDEISGLDIARSIRKNDLNSFIIISTTHTDFLPFAIKSRLLIYDFISKFDDYSNNLYVVLKEIVDKIYDQKTIQLIIDKEIKNIKLKNIKKIEYDEKIKSSIIILEDKKIYINKSLNYIYKKLDSRFIKNKSEIVRKEQ